MELNFFNVSKILFYVCGSKSICWVNESTKSALDLTRTERTDEVSQKEFEIKRRMSSGHSVPKPVAVRHFFLILTKDER